nr:EOG090X07PL [Polyphemus pediculus]
MFLLCRNSFVSVQLKSPGLILLNIDIGSEDNVPFSYQVSKTFEKEMKEKLPIITKSAALTPIKRGGILNAQRYLITSDERIIEYDVDHVVVDHQSPFQRIQILHTINFGNVLILDENQNLAESDLIYTETLMQRGKIDYKDKEVLILGGGDGALLSELMKEKPKMVTMVEIDEDVIKFCRQHLRSACGSALDSLSGDNYKIVIGDCLVELEIIIRLSLEIALWSLINICQTELNLTSCLAI